MLAIILGVMDLLVAWQMLLRLALLILLIVLAPLAFLCGALHQTQGYMRLWISTFAATVFIQFFQSLFSSWTEMGEPIVMPCLTPERM
jgi:hypothetical protein